MGIVHVAIYDAAVAIEDGYRPFLPTPRAPAHTSPAVAIAAAAHDTLVGLQPALGLNPGQQAILDGDYAAYMAAIPDGTAKANGLAIGQQVAAAVIAWRANDGRDHNPTVADLDPPARGPGVWQPDPTRPVLGLRLPGIRPLALITASQFRPDGPPALTSQKYADDLNQVEQLGAIDSSTRTARQTEQALFWTDHDLRMWNDGLLRLAAHRGFDLVQTARMLAIAHVAGGDAMIACFDAKYHYWFWRPYQAIPAANTDANPNTTADLTWQPLDDDAELSRVPSAHACHSTAGRHRARCVLRHRQDSDDTRQPRHPHHAPLQPTARHRHRRRLGTRPRRISLPKLRPAGQLRSDATSDATSRDTTSSQPAEHLGAEAANRRAASRGRPTARPTTNLRSAARPPTSHPYLGKGRVSATTSAASTAFGFTPIRVGRLRS